MNWNLFLAISGKILGCWAWIGGTAWIGAACYDPHKRHLVHPLTIGWLLIAGASFMLARPYIEGELYGSLLNVPLFLALLITGTWSLFVGYFKAKRLFDVGGVAAIHAAFIMNNEEK